MTLILAHHLVLDFFLLLITLHCYLRPPSISTPSVSRDNPARSRSTRPTHPSRGVRLLLQAPALSRDVIRSQRLSFRFRVSSPLLPTRLQLPNKIPFPTNFLPKKHSFVIYSFYSRNGILAMPVIFANNGLFFIKVVVSQAIYSETWLQ